MTKKAKKAEKNYSMTKTRHIPARAGREEGVPAGAAKKREVDKSKAKKNRQNRQKGPKKRKKIIEGKKLITYLLKRRGNRGRRVFQQVHLKKMGVISKKSKNNNKKGQKRPKKRNK